MRVLIDENLPRKIAHHVTGHKCRTVLECGWAGRKNGELLALAEPEFDDDSGQECPVLAGDLN